MTHLITVFVENMNGNINLIGLKWSFSVFLFIFGQQVTSSMQAQKEKLC